MYSPPLSSDIRNKAAAAYVAEKKKDVTKFCANDDILLSMTTGNIPTPSFLECNNSVSGAVAPSPSIICAPSLSAANSHSTPAATLKTTHHNCFPLSWFYANSFALPLDILDFVVEELYKYGDHREAANDGAVVRLPRQDVQRSHCPLNDFLHAHAIGIRTARLLSILKLGF